MNIVVTCYKCQKKFDQLSTVFSSSIDRKDYGEDDTATQLAIDSY